MVTQRLGPPKLIAKSRDRLIGLADRAVSRTDMARLSASCGLLELNELVYHAEHRQARHERKKEIVAALDGPRQLGTTNANDETQMRHFRNGK